MILLVRRRSLTQKLADRDSAIRNILYIAKMTNDALIECDRQGSGCGTAIVRYIERTFSMGNTAFLYKRDT